MNARQRALASLRLDPVAASAALDGFDDAWSRWGRGVVLMAVGSYREAFAIFAPLADAEDGELAGLAAAALASGLRQLDEHLAAVGWDDRALVSEGVARVDGWIGRAADEVGRGRADRAAAYLGRADEDSGGGWRDRTRLGWVRTEIALLRGDLAGAEAHACGAVEAASAAGSPRHLAKSRLFLAVVRRSAQHKAAVAELRAALAQSAAMRLRPLMWPAVVVLGDDATLRERHAGAEAVRHIAAHLPDGYGLGWRDRSDVNLLISARKPR